MSLGLNAIRGIIDTGSVTAFRQLKAEWFVEEELEAFQFVKDHFRRYSRLPDRKTMEENGFVLNKVRQPAQYYIDKLSARAVYNSVRDNHGQLLDAMKGKDVREIKKALKVLVQSTRAVDNSQDFSTLDEQALAVLDEYKEAKSNPGLQGITTGFPVLDEVTNGLQPGDVIALAGRPNIGKSYLLLKMMNAAWRAGSPCGGVSMEMKTRQLARRFLGMETGLNPDLIRKGQLSSNYGERLLKTTIRDIQNRPPIFFLEGNFRKSVSDVDNMIQEFSPDIAFIDAGYLLTPDKASKGYVKRNEHVAAVMEEIKMMAENRKIPVVVSVQFNREMKKGGKKEMDVSFLAETDVIGQIATLVLGIRHGRTPLEDVTREIGLIKNREGALITFQTNFNFNPMNFDYRPGSEALDRVSQSGLDEQGQEALDNNMNALENSGWSM